MEARFWLERWLKDQIGFHQKSYNPMLIEHWSALDVLPGSQVFVPLCGKSLDMRWLGEQGYSVCAIELSRIAVEGFFDTLDETPVQEPHGAFVRYRGKFATVYCGDFFELTAKELASAEAVFDRGALVALPPRDMRTNYVDHLLRVLPEGVVMLLVTIEYDQNLVSGPPFSIHPEEVDELFADRCDVERLGSAVTAAVPPHFQAQGVERAGESAYRIVKTS